MDWTSLVAALGVFGFAYGIAPWRMRSTMWLVLWLCAVCGLVAASIRYQPGPAVALLGGAFCLGTSLRNTPALQKRKPIR
jgi:hypothetical protein